MAIKQLRDDRISDTGGYEKAKEEFFKEARIFKLMNHPNLVQVEYFYCLKFHGGRIILDDLIKY